MNREDHIHLSNYTYHLPEDRIAKYPLPNRDDSKLLIYKNGNIDETKFSDLSNYIPTNSRLIFNNTRVIHARLRFRKKTGALIEIFCLAPHEPVDYQQSFSENSICTWRCMVGNFKKWKGDKLLLETTISEKKVILTAESKGLFEESQLIQFRWNAEFSFGELLEHLGSIPIPPYLKRPSELIDDSRYQTIYSRLNGSVAAPTAGLHFTNKVLDSLKNKNIILDEITLHVGAGTFQPVKHGNVLDHKMHAESFSVKRELINSIGNSGNTIISTGTTTLRTLESIYWLGLKSIRSGKLHTKLEQWEYNELDEQIPATEVFSAFDDMLGQNGIEEYRAETQLMVIPGYDIKVADALITNYHQPGSTLLLLVAAFIGSDWRRVYEYSMNHDFRFLSYGDSSLLWKNELLL